MLSRSDIAVAVRGLSKAYTIAHNNERHATLAEQVLSRFKNPFKQTRSETFWALKDVEFDIKKGDVVGIIGRNGAGKSTLLKILSRITEPTAGEIKLYGRVGSLLEVGTGFHPELTGRENVYLNGQILGMRKREIDKQFDAIVDFAGVEKFLDTPVKRYSSGMYVRLAFAVAAHLDSDILIVDEVLAVGDQQFQEKCLGKMKDVSASGRTVFFVSHNMAAVADLCTTGILLQAGCIAADGHLRNVINRYLDNHSGNEAVFESGPLKRVSIRQEEAGLIVEGDFDHSEPLSLPALGFVISDVMGTPVCGANPRLENSPPLAVPRRRGHVRGSLSQPRLMDGTYRLSVWFGDQHQDFVSHKDCVTFSVAGMAGPRQLPVAIVGPVYPECAWELDADGNDTPSENAGLEPECPVKHAKRN